MAHDPTKVLLGSVPSNVKTVGNHIGSIEAGLVARLKSDDTLSIASADGELLGVSLGISQSDNGRTAIARKGLRVPLILTDAFTPTVGDVVSVSDTTGKGATAGGGVTAVNAVYATSVLTGIKEDGVTEIPVALIDMQGGL